MNEVMVARGEGSGRLGSKGEEDYKVQTSSYKLTRI